MLWKKIFVIIAIGLASTASLAETEFVNTKTSLKVNLDDKALNALKNWNSKFQLYGSEDFPAAVKELFAGIKDELPMAVRADFDGDKTLDLALLGHNLKNQFVVVLFNKDKRYEVKVLQTNPYVDPKKLNIETSQGPEDGLGFYLGIVKAKDLNFKGGKNVLSPRDGLQLENFGGLTQAFYYKDGKFIEYKGLAQ